MTFPFALFWSAHGQRGWAVNVESRRAWISESRQPHKQADLCSGSQGKAAFRRVASKGVYAGGGSIAEGGKGCKPWLKVVAERPTNAGLGAVSRHSHFEGRSAIDCRIR
ncbi:hypothetical protein MESS2_790114 [Mesorhizobium metallidurans STM 2683]|uniref:Uncharacterized protein n=1 Tax=Mesorhizobium metallidurans STM 2683 TaxID=1297569 RepID=M5EXC6_9HYPH|nr:hypothetical protein MESS2_790114 [Mesorhizobium metallidurans STM 2683]